MRNPSTFISALSLAFCLVLTTFAQPAWAGGHNDGPSPVNAVMESFLADMATQHAEFANLRERFDNNREQNLALTESTLNEFLVSMGKLAATATNVISTINISRMRHWSSPQLPLEEVAENQILNKALYDAIAVLDSVSTVISELFRLRNEANFYSQRLSILRTQEEQLIQKGPGAELKLQTTRYFIGQTQATLSTLPDPDHSFATFFNTFAAGSDRKAPKNERERRLMLSDIINTVVTEHKKCAPKLRRPSQNDDDEIDLDISTRRKPPSMPN